MLTWDISVCVCPCLTAGLFCPGAMTYASSVSCRTCTGAWIIFRSFFAGEKMSDPVRMDIKWSSACQSCSAKSFRLCQVARVLRAVHAHATLAAQEFDFSDVFSVEYVCTQLYRWCLLHFQSSSSL